MTGTAPKLSGLHPCAQSSAVQSPCWGAAHVLGAHLWRPRARGPWLCAPPSGSLRLQSRGRRTSWRTRTPCTPPWPGGGRTPALQVGREQKKGARCCAAARPHPSRPFRLAAHTCSSTQERTNPPRSSKGCGDLGSGVFGVTLGASQDSQLLPVRQGAGEESGAGSESPSPEHPMAHPASHPSS